MNKNRTMTVALILGIICLIWLLYDTFQIFLDLPGVLTIASVGLPIVIGYPFILLFHLVSFWILLHHRMTIRNLGSFGSFLLFLGIASLFSIAVEKVMFDELAHEISFWQQSWMLAGVQGFTTVVKVMAILTMGEFVMLAGAFAVNILFAALILVFLVRALRIKNQVIVDPSMKEDILFTSAHSMGVVTGLLGLFLTVPVMLSGFPVEKFWVIIPFYVLFSLPYDLTIVMWLAVKSKQDIARWYDEKQWYDMLKSSFSTMLLSIPGLALLLIIPNPIHFYWFPYYLFLILTLFSAGTIYLYRKQ